nr:unnamed protein product [Callosobruchus analis]
MIGTALQIHGHTLKTHCSFYRLSDNLYQTAKVSKLLLLSASGGIEKYKGKLLDDIEINLSPIIEQSDQLLSITDTDNGSAVYQLVQKN